MTWLGDHELAELRHEVVELRREVEVSARFLERLSESVAELTENQAAQLARLEAIEALLSHQPNPNQATGLVLTIGGRMSDVSVNVDVTNEIASATFVDDHGDTGATPPAGPDGNPATVQYGSSNTAVVTVDPTSGALSFVAVGEADISATAVDSTGTAIAGFPTASAHVSVTPGAAVGLQVSVEGASPVPAPGA